MMLYTKLQTLHLSTEKQNTRRISTISFICSIHAWHDVPTKVNFVSKILQSTNINIQVALDALSDLEAFLVASRNDGKLEICSCK
jgi:hypothetical protein